MIQFRDLVELVRSLGYAGIFLHFDNFEQFALEDPRKMQLFFHKVRDILQTPHVYFAFVGYPEFYQRVIQPIERVRSIFFNFPVHLPALSEAQIGELLERRYQLLSSGKIIKPVEDAFVGYLYRLHGGKIRSILDALSTVIANFPSEDARTLASGEAQNVLTRVFSEQLASCLSPKMLAVLRKIAEAGECTNSEIARRLKQSPAGTFRIFKELEQRHFIRVSRRQAQKIFYQVNEQLKILRPGARSFDVLPTQASAPDILSELQKKFMALLTKQGKLNLAEFCRLTETPPARARKEVKGLLQHRLIAKHGFTRGLYYTQAERE